jgi:hypothetical protein
VIPDTSGAIQDLANDIYKVPETRHGAIRTRRSGFLIHGMQTDQQSVDKYRKDEVNGLWGKKFGSAARGEEEIKNVCD